jgi:hypothetical protein
MKTLLFCTSYMSHAGKWRNRYRRWLALHRQIPIEHDAVFMFDDASPYRPDDADVRVIDALLDELEPRGTYLYRFAEHLGRADIVAFRGWWRGFAFSLDVAERYGFEKLLHVESDAYLLSRELVDYLNTLDSGWTVFWCPRHECPESNVQVVCRDQFAALRAATTRAFTTGCRQAPESTLPFTYVETSFVGDRYGEYLKEVPPDADYAAQVYSTMTVSYRE